MSSLTTDTILIALRHVIDPDHGRDVVGMGLISGITIKQNKVGFLITIAPEDKDRKAWLQSACEQAVRGLPEVTDVTAILTADTSPSQPATPTRKAATWNTNPLPHVAKILAIASGKGGVGKSTVTMNLAHALHAQGVRVGVLDADIYGPSLPRMMGLSEKPESQGNMITPSIAHGIACMSMGLLIDAASAVVWRGPQLGKALQQLLRGVVWGTKEAPLDILLIDTPPGTGDVHLSLVQQVPVNGVILVTTPQEVAVADARKCADMFHKVHVPIVGVIENMSGFVDPATGVTHAIFGEGGGAQLASENQTAFLGSIPLDMTLRIASDDGSCWNDPHHYFANIAKRII